MPEQLSLFDREESRPARKGRRTVDLDAMRTDLEALELTADQIRQYERMGKAFAAVGEEFRKRMREGAHQGDDSAPFPHREDDQRAHYPHQPGPGESPGAQR